MFDESAWQQPGQETHTVDGHLEPQSIDEVELTTIGRLPVVKVVASLGII